MEALFTGCDPIQIRLFTQKEAKNDIKKLEKMQDHQVKLTTALVTTREPPEELEYYEEAYRHSDPAEGKAAGDHSSMSNVNNLPSALPSLTGPQVCALYQFLQLNGNYSLVPTKEDGDCLYGAFRRGTDLPAEVADNHIKRCIVRALCHYHSFFYGYLSHAIGMIYGVERLDPAVLAEKIKKKQISSDDLRDQRLPGPLSFIDWIKLILQESAYGDEIVILVMSLLWQLKITVLYADDLSEKKFRHNQRITQVDMLLVYSGNTQHFVGAGRGLNLFRSACNILGSGHQKRCPWPFFE